jgi:hypothetical protein
MPLPAPCHWIEDSKGAYLNWHYGCIAYVTLRDGKPLVTIQWGSIRETHPAASIAQGKRHLERWIEGCGAWPRRCFLAAKGSGRA